MTLNRTRYARPIKSACIMKQSLSLELSKGRATFLLKKQATAILYHKRARLVFSDHCHFQSGKNSHSATLTIATCSSSLCYLQCKGIVRQCHSPRRYATDQTSTLVLHSLMGLHAILAKTRQHAAPLRPRIQHPAIHHLQRRPTRLFHPQVSNLKIAMKLQHQCQCAVEANLFVPRSIGSLSNERSPASLSYFCFWSLL